MELRSPLSAEERIEKRKLIVRDVTALLTLFAITAVLATLTWLLFSSFTQHRKDLAQRWLTRGRAAMAAGHPDQAVIALRSALEYQEGAPAAEQRETEIALASALAAAGRANEATAYFNTLLEAAPGNGVINLQLARLAAKQGHEAQAVESYQRALDGVWQGDGYQRRLQVRLELVGYLLSLKEFSRAQGELLTAAGNAPDEPEIKIRIAGLMEQAGDPQNAFLLYRKLATEHKPPLEALEGAGRTAAALGRFQIARQFLARALGDFALDKQPESERDAVRNQLASAVRLLSLYPDPDLTPRARTQRILRDVAIAQARFDGCLQKAQASASPDSTNSQTVPGSLGALDARWQQVPPNLNLHSLEDDPDLQQSLMTLVYDTEKVTAQTCGQPTGNDALLFEIAQAPWAIDQP
ncbi:tetratricopeptide repeat protein [Silvibacterium sp.]|uniref:tetratricopeptide repeat protein n=1 Tax=Silvibacterium sp. TaxID=1964179 RepID=UPI0039E2D2B0